MSRWEKRENFWIISCDLCNRAIKKVEDDYVYRRAFVNAAGHSDRDWACRQCIEERKLLKKHKIKPECIYVVSRLSPKVSGPQGTLQYIFNFKQSLKVGAEIWRKGHYPFIPGLDFLIFLEMDGDYGENDLPYEASLEWLRRCDSVLILNGLEDSEGAQKEHKEAKRLGKNIYLSIDDIQAI